MSEGHEVVIDSAALADYVERVARLMREQQSLAEDISELCAAADQAGVASKREIRKLARESLMEPEVLTAQLVRMQELRDALKSFAGTPLGEAAMRRETAEVVEMHKPRPFAEQTVHNPQRRRGRPRKNLIEAAREHLGGSPVA